MECEVGGPCPSVGCCSGRRSVVVLLGSSDRGERFLRRSAAGQPRSAERARGLQAGGRVALRARGAAAEVDALELVGDLVARGAGCAAVLALQLERRGDEPRRGPRRRASRASMRDDAASQALLLAGELVERARPRPATQPSSALAPSATQRLHGRGSSPAPSASSAHELAQLAHEVGDLRDLVGVALEARLHEQALAEDVDAPAGARRSGRRSCRAWRAARR